MNGQGLGQGRGKGQGRGMGRRRQGCLGAMKPDPMDSEAPEPAGGEAGMDLPKPGRPGRGGGGLGRRLRDGSCQGR